MPDFHLRPGDTVDRMELHARYGGKTKGTIAPSRVTASVFLFSTPETGPATHYSDRWIRYRGETRYLFVGEGLVADHRMSHGNLQVANHHADGRALRLFIGSRGEVTYVGKFEVDPDLPAAPLDAPDQNRAARRVIGFPLRPVNDVEPSGRIDDLDAGPAPTDLDPADIAAFDSDTPSRPTAVHTTEGELVKRYRSWAYALGRDPRPYRLPPEPGELRVTFVDLYDPDAGTVVEATGTAARQAIRAAIGKLADVADRLQPHATAVLLPSAPGDATVRLLHAAGHDVIYENDTGEFDHLRADPDGAFVVHDQAPADAGETAPS